ncbi:RNA polymerase recycling motor ATPase HelR [Kitasatospora sp. CB02891]|uniref:RNA polymerase recycling motor ATPase HelR n=1 Tax=Kitasatospora sp. CB02891 TaxID=2020329 RepID=UPI000C27A0FF|nr:RNA polymerase recycling motor ATPase HelR [Kitasatospora sp. CB02891]PJN29898.1 AAA family ATPase [Kitasatospora sp. CB02891]
MTHQTTSAFELPERLAAKADPALIADDERHFATVAATLEQDIAELTARLDQVRRSPGGTGRAAMDRDNEVHQLSSRLRTLRRFGSDLCLGRIVQADQSEPVYIGRLGLADGDGRRLLIDWRSPAAEPFFAATHANPMGLTSRRRYRWQRGKVGDYWDEVFTADALDGHAALDDQSAFIASLGSARSERMRDVLATIQADQDAIIRAGSRGALVVDGGPGTGKTVVALHRTAHLLYSDPRLGHRKGRVLFVGPHQPYLAYVADVLPSLGEEGVQTCTLRDLLPEGAAVAEEEDAEVARLKAVAGMVGAIEQAVGIYEEPPTEACKLAIEWYEISVQPEDWSEAFAAVGPGTPHNEARETILDELITILIDRNAHALDDEEHGISPEMLARELRRDRELLTALRRAWPILEPTDLVGDLWTVPAYLRLCAPWLSREEIRTLQRTDPAAWTLSDLPLLDAARRRLGDTAADRRQRAHRARLAAEREMMDGVVDHLLNADDDGEGATMMLGGADLRDALIDHSEPEPVNPDLLAGPFAHIVVDEAQELTDAEWQMLIARCPSRSFTIVGDRAQARHGFTESWTERLERAGLERITLTSLSVNYRTPEEVMAEAEPVIRAALPDANVPTSIRRSGLPVLHGAPADRDALLDAWLAEHPEGTACVIGDPDYPGLPRVRSLTPELVKGLEFDLVVLIDPESFGEGIEGAVDRYVAMTRATGQLAVLRH